MRADREEVLLYQEETIELVADVALPERDDRQADGGVELVNRPVRLDPRIVLANATASEEARFAGIAGPGVDLHVRCADSGEASRIRNARFPSLHSSHRSLRRTLRGVHSSPSNTTFDCSASPSRLV